MSLLMKISVCNIETFKLNKGLVFMFCNGFRVVWGPLYNDEHLPLASERLTVNDTFPASNPLVFDHLSHTQCGISCK